MSRFVVLVVSIAFALTVSAKKGYGPGEQDWGFVDVRQGAHMFYWLYYTTAEVSHYTDRPLAIWLQGGPGMSSTGLGNFNELGPLDLQGNPRNTTWVKNMNVLFIDTPVGSGFSNVDNPSLLTKNNREIIQDLVTFIKEFYKRHPEFCQVPLHIFTESYSTKYAPGFALSLLESIQKGEVQSNLQSVNLGSAWISAIDVLLEWAPMLRQMAMVDENGYANVVAAVNKNTDLIQQQKWSEGTALLVGDTQAVVRNQSQLVDFFNILSTVPQDSSNTLANLMNGPVRAALNIPSSAQWGSQQQITFSALAEDFLKPVLEDVTQLLENTNLQVTIISGQLDLVCPTLGIAKGISKMTWSYKEKYDSADHAGFIANNIMEGYKKSANNFTTYWFLRCGHSYPVDNPAAMDYVLREITKYDQVKNKATKSKNKTKRKKVDKPTRSNGGYV